MPFCNMLLLMVANLVMAFPGHSQPKDNTGALERRSPYAAGFLEYAFPFAGYVYAGDPKRGVMPNIVRISGGILCVSEISKLGDDNLSNINPTILASGVIISATGTIWAVTGAVATANQRNEQVRGSKSYIGVGLGVHRCPSMFLRITL